MRLRSTFSPRVADRLRDLLRGDRAEQLSVLARAVRDREHGLGEQRRCLLRPLGLLALGALRRLAATPGVLERSLGRRLGELAGNEIVAEVAGDTSTASPALRGLDVLEQDRFAIGSRPRSPTYGSRASSRARFTATASWRWWVRESPLPGANGPCRGRREPAQRREILVIDLLDVDPRVLAGTVPLRASSPAWCLSLLLARHRGRPS